MAGLAAPERGRVELSDDEIAPPPGPPPSRRQVVGDFAPPPGPPLSHRQAASDDFAPPPGPPPSQSNNPFRQQATATTTSIPTPDFAPPAGPSPPAFSASDYAAPPPGPPPSSHGAAQPGAHDWQTLVPDTSLLPPPPDIFSGHDRSPATNADEADADAGEAWCAAHPLSAPLDLLDSAALLDGRRAGAVRLMAPTTVPPAAFRGRLDWLGGGVWRGRTEPRARDCCYVAHPPLYAVRRDSPLLGRREGKRTRARTVAYYEVRVLAEGNNKGGEIGLAIGFAALPYPTFRMPGWHRGSLAVHGDDGHRYVNDRWGGREFAAPMRMGETYGLGMVFTVVEEDAGRRIETEVFYTREGAEVGRWDLHEETDAEQDLPVTGLEGYHDLAAAVGSFGAVAFEAVFDPGKWKYKAEVY